MFRSLKKIVIGLGILIIFLTIIVFYAIFKKFNHSDNYNNILLENNQLFLVEEKFKIISIDVDKNLVYLHLRSKNKEILRVKNLENGKTINEYLLK